MAKNLILGAGLAGLSTSYHLAHSSCLILEKSHRTFGHARSWDELDCTWDEGPHVSFTKQTYAKKLIEAFAGENLRTFSPVISNWFQGNWITHPVQTHLYQVPEPLRSACVDSFLESSSTSPVREPKDYQEWLDQSLGSVIANTFSGAYTRKYWTVEPNLLTTCWVGERVYRPDAAQVIAGASGPIEKNTHYFTEMRYTHAGGFQALFSGLGLDANVRFNASVKAIDLKNKTVHYGDSQAESYETLFTSIPLPNFVDLCLQSTADLRAMSRELDCTQLHVVNVLVPHLPRRTDHWMYVYDESKYSTRITIPTNLSAQSSPCGTCSIQVEVYSSRYRPLDIDEEMLRKQVILELVELGLVDEAAVQRTQSTIHYIPFANIMFTHRTRELLDGIWQFFEQWGLVREHDDLWPMTNWNSMDETELGSIVPIGRFGQWKYFWSDDCILRGRSVAATSSVV